MLTEKSIKNPEISKFESAMIYLLYHTLLDHLMGNLKFY